MPKLMLPTKFASAERSSTEKLAEQFQILSYSGNLSRVIDAIPHVVAILNANRQVVLPNKRLLAFLGMQDTGDACGKRPGELVGCIHADSEVGGCGTSEFCRFCGAVTTVLASQLGETRTSDCRIRRVDGEAMDLRITAVPLRVEGEEFTIVSLDDIADKKRREALERTFFHDIVNSAGGIQGLSDILLHSRSQQQTEEITPILHGMATRLVDEILAQRDLLAAERNELAVDPSTIDTADFIEETVSHMEQHETTRGRILFVDPKNEHLDLNTAKPLLGRILINMIKNALEAVSEGETVTVGCRSADGRVCFRVHNPGCMSQSAQAQVFQRSFSTKGVGRGLGTYSMKLLGEQYMGGKITFISTPEAGTIFTFELPLETEEAPSPSSE